MEIDKELLKGYIDIIILAMLHDQDFYGYDLAKRVKEQTDGRFELKEGTLYLSFKRLEQSGLVESYWGDVSGGSKRKYYKLLPEGRATLRRKKQEWHLIKELMDLFLEGTDDHE